MVVNVIGEQNSIFNQFLGEIRDEEIQKDSMRFRRNMERVGEVMAYEISKTMDFEEREVTTPLGIANVKMLPDKPVLAAILRAGLPLHQGMLNYFDHADNAFISAFRKYNKEGSFDIQLEYISCPPLDDRTLIICDPMLATGSSMVVSYLALLQNGKPKHVHLATVIAAKEGINYLRKQICTKNVTLWTGAIDDELTVKSYIVPGLGDAGDLAYGCKEH